MLHVDLKLIAEIDFSGIILFLISECDLDLKGIESLGLEESLYDEVYYGNCLSLEYERDLYLERGSCLYGDL